MKKTEITKLDKVWREKIKERDIYCQVCGSSNTLNSHHVVGRRNRTLRWDLDNGILLCAGCHTFKTQSAHQNPRWFQEWFKKEFPNRDKHLKRYENKILKKEFEEIMEELCEYS